MNYFREKLTKIQESFENYTLADGKCDGLTLSETVDAIIKLIEDELPKKKERCLCYDNGNKPALLTNFHSGSNICASCGKPMSSELKIHNQAIQEMKRRLGGE